MTSYNTISCWTQLRLLEPFAGIIKIEYLPMQITFSFSISSERFYEARVLRSSNRPPQNYNLMSWGQPQSQFTAMKTCSLMYTYLPYKLQRLKEKNTAYPLFTSGLFNTKLQSLSIYYFLNRAALSCPIFQSILELKMRLFPQPAFIHFDGYYRSSVQFTQVLKFYFLKVILFYCLILWLTFHILLHSSTISMFIQIIYTTIYMDAFRVQLFVRLVYKVYQDYFRYFKSLESHIIFQQNISLVI